MARKFFWLPLLGLFLLAAAPRQLLSITPTPSPSASPTPRPYSEGPLVIGHSVQGRPLEVWRFGTGPRAYLVMAGIHGGYEVNTSHLAIELINHFAVNPDDLPAEATLYILPVFNPDGAQYPYQTRGRANANGVDLNRNYPNEDWVPQWPKAGCWNYLPIHGGEHALSEPETAALINFIITHQPLTALISYHAAAPGFYPALGEESELLAIYLAEASGYPYPPPFTGCHMTGSLADWSAGQGVPAIDVELSDHYRTEFEINLRLVQALLLWELPPTPSPTPAPPP